MSTKSFLENYKDTRLNPEDKEKLQTSFVEFNYLFEASLRLIKNNFVTGWIFPGLWSFLVQIIAIVMTFIIILGLTSSTDLVSNYYKYYDSFQKMDFSFVTNTFIWQVSLSVLFMLITSSLFTYWIQIKQYGLLNDRTSSGIWKLKENFLAKLGQLILTRLLIFALYLPIILVFVFFVATLSNGSNNVGLSILLVLLFLILLVFSSFIPAFLGLFEQLIIHENLQPLKAIKTSYNLSIQKFWPNIGRWFLFALCSFGLSLLFAFIQQVISGIFKLGYSQDSLVDQLDALAVIGVIISGFIYIIQGFVYWIFFTAFGYTSFYNFRHTIFEKETENFTQNSIEDNTVVSV